MVVPRLEITGASKTFGRRTVLRDVQLSVAPGEIHGVIGQNGSGKSTLAKIISGYHGADRGTTLKIDGEQLHLPVRVRDLDRAGVAIVHQDLGLLPDRDIVTNIRVGSVGAARVTRRINWKAESAKALASLHRLGFRTDPRTPVGQLEPADQARVAIARALQRLQPGHGLIVFDESTRALPEDALTDFYATVSRVASEGTSITIISHRLSEILQHCDRVSVLRDGQCVAHGVRTGELSEAQLAAIMLGHDLAHLEFPARAESTSEPAVRVTSVLGSRLTSGFDLTLGPGEIVGLTGLPGSGYERIPYMLSRAAPAHAGSMVLGSEKIDLASTSLTAMMRRGVVLIPGNRLGEGLAIEQSIRANIALPWLALHARPWAMGNRWQRREARAVIQGLQVTPADDTVAVGKLSGGNQQKVLLGKWLAGRPRLLLLHEPTQAVDIKARHGILEAIDKVAAAGTPVVVASSDATDLGLLCDRILIFRHGVVDHTIPGHCHPQEIIDVIY